MADTSNDDRRQRLSAARQELLKRRLQGKASGTGAAPVAVLPALQARAERSVAPASYSQARLYFLDQLHDAGAAYHMPLCLRLRGPLDRAALGRSVEALVLRHAALRTTFAMREGELVQRVSASAEVHLTEVDLGAAQGDPERALTQTLRGLLQAPFALADGPLLRACLVRLASEDHVLALVLHHIIADEWSLALLRRELASCYRQGGSTQGLAPLEVDYGDYALWQREQIDPQRATQLAYWRERLRDLDGSLAALASDHRRPRRPSLRGGWVQADLGDALGSAVGVLARQHQATPYMVLLAAFLAVLSRLGGQRDVRVGTPMAARTPAQTEGLVGLFLNSVVIRESVGEVETFVELLGRVRETTLGAVAHQALPFEVLVAELQPGRDLGTNPLFQTMFVLESDDGAQADFGELIQTRVPVESGYAKLDLTCFVRLDDDRLHVSVEYARDLYEPATAQLLIDTYGQFLQSAVAAPRTSLAQLALLPAAKAQSVREAAAGPALPKHDGHASLVPQILERLDARAEQVVLEGEGQQFTGADLRERAHRVAGALAQRGVRPGDRVVMALARGPQQIVGLLGVLLAGAAYVPLDPDYPAERRRQVIESLSDADQAPVVLCDESLPIAEGQRLTLTEALASPPLAAAMVPASDDLAYLIYTSGSTGRAKGVAVSHGSLLASTRARAVHYAHAPQRFLLVSSCAFDSSIAGIFWTLSAGDTLVVAGAAEAVDARLLARCIEQQQITHTLMLPGLYSLVLEAATPPQLASLRTVIVAGEACPVAVAQAHARTLPQAQLTNEYGPTEATVWATAYDCSGSEVDHVPIGRPIAGASAYVLDAQRRLLPHGAVGELWLGGPGVAVGYLGQPALTAERFAELPEISAGRLYRTGDLVRWDHQGNLAYLGRADEQIKLRGFRIEPAELEGLLRSHPQVRDGAVGVVDAGAGARLAAWFVPEGATADSRALREHLSTRVPAYMVPAHYHAVEALPRLPNGKVDRARLPALAVATDACADESAGQDFADEVQRDLAAIWRKLLAVEAVAPQDDFFDLGGHSLAGVSLMLEIERRFGLSLPLAVLFQAPRLSQLAERIREGRTRRAPLLIPVQAQGSRTPLICVHGGARQAARHLGQEQPVYLAFTHLSDRDSEGNSVQTMAERYLAEVREVQAQGPYRLCGFSFGGKIAYEMAGRLRAQGESVSLALCDPPPPAGADYYRQQWRVRREELKAQGVAGGLRLGAQVLQGRLRTWRMRFLDAYFSRSRRASRGLYGASAALVLLGLGLWLGAGWALNQPNWRPLVLDLAPQQEHAGTFAVSEAGRIELALEVDRAVSQPELRRSVLAVKQPPPLDVRWQVLGGDGQVLARSDVRDYAYIDPGPRTWLGRLRRVLLRVPFGQSEAYFSSFGLVGLPAAERGVGAFDARAGETYRLEVSTGDDLRSIEALAPRFVARLDRGRFAERYQRTAPVAITGLLTALFGLALGVLTAVRQRQSTPASLLSYRDRQHYRRMSGRYVYPPYDGDLTLLLPETYAVYREETERAWASKVVGQVHLELIPGARRHVDLINETAGQLLAAGLARWLARVEKESHEQS